MKKFKKISASLLTACALAMCASSASAADLETCPVAGSTDTYGEPFVITNGFSLDDGSQEIDNLGAIFPGGLVFQGTTYASLYLNINGNVSFGAARSTYDPQSIPGLNYPILAPFFADVDLRGDSIGNIYTCRDVANQRIIFTWNEVGYFSRKTDKRNSFQIILTDTTDECSDPSVTTTFDLQFRYKKLEWTTGDVSGGSGGLGGDEATAGIDAGDTVNAVALPGSGTADVLDLVTETNVGEPGVFEYRVADGTLPECGDSSAGLCEECDLGTDNGPNSACTPICTVAICGDGYVHEGVEECDEDSFDSTYENCPAGYTGQPLCNNDPANSSGDGTCTASLEGCNDIDECAADPSLCANGTCVNSPGSYTCDCDAGYELNGSGVCVNIDECADSTLNTCDANATCTDTDGDYTCACDDGYEGDGETCTDVDECADSTLNTCDTNATCTNTPGDYTCACDDGYEGDGETCTNVDECTLGTDTCDANATCADTDGSFTCTCDAGYEGDGETCTDVDECADSTLNTCDQNAICTDTDGGFTCACAAGYAGDGETCTNVDECADSTLNTCADDATCTDTDGGYVCACDDGYEGDGESCTDVDECADDTLNECDENATCTNEVGSYTCACNPGYVGDGRVCGDRECTEEEAIPCGETGSCGVTDNVVQCVCGDGYELDDDGACVDVDECADDTLNTCAENAQCTNDDGTYTCECDEGYEGDGDSCIDVDECADDALNDCDANATCTDTDGGFTCECDPGYVGDGRSCGERECTDEEADACGDSGSCTVVDNAVQCVCGDGYESSDDGACVDVDECADDALNTCAEDATCTNTDGDHTCACDEGFEGDGQNCEPTEEDVVDDAPDGVISGGGLASCSSTGANPANSPLALVLLGWGGIALLRRRSRGSSRG